ncbi:MAG TPA: tetratricopeptide repeat protein [Usitatibacteraceae bacterium]|nr:tetratricopeptide repeat protein [Usitatibacteraceae bacterium]
MTELRALLMTDLVESTRLSQRIGDAEMARLWAAHDRAARDLLSAWRGREIDKTDGMLLLFDAAADAVGYAVAYQEALRALVPPLEARAGLHVGPVMLRENSAADVALGAKPLEVEGLAKAIASRVMSVARGGQVLVSADARRAIEGEAIRLQSHGHWRLKGVDEPLELFEAGDERTLFLPPPDADKAYRVVRHDGAWLPAREIRHSLPVEPDAFVGRAQTVADLARRFHAGARLVSVLGIGGSGKTRLAMRFGRGWLGEFPGGAWFCDLAPARSLDGILNAVAQGLAVPLGKGEPVEQLGRAIAGRGRCLVILDNFEQVADRAAATLGRWLERPGEARFLVTTREVLGLPGEEVLALPPLPPADAAALFLLRAAAADSGFRPRPEDEAAIGPLVALLDGLPLAIELAAARARVMPPRMLLARMGERFKLLAARGRRLDRQATLRATFDWSWDLLPPVEKEVLAQLSVFAGGFTLEAAEAVIDLSRHDQAPWIVDAIQALADKSLLRPRGDGRFDLLVSVREYAAEHLGTEGRFPGSGPQAVAAAQRRHAAWYAALGPVRAEEGDCVELENLVAACRRAIALREGLLAAGALEGAWAALRLRGPFETGVELAEEVCAMPDLDDRALARALPALAHARQSCGRPGNADTLCEKALASARATRDGRGEIVATMRLGSLEADKGRLGEARERFLVAIRMAREAGDAKLECTANNELGTVEYSEGRLDEALAHYERAEALAREAGDRRMQGIIVGNLGNLQADLGHAQDARARHEEALAIARETGHRQLEGNTLCNLGMLHTLQGRLPESEAASAAALVLARALGHVRLECIVLCNLGIVLEALARPEEARSRFEAALAIARTLGDSRSEGQFLGYLGLLHARQGRQEEARRCLASGEALLRAASDPVSLGVLLASRAEAEHLAGDAAAAAASLEAAAKLAEEVGAGPSSEIGIAIARVRSLPGTA